MEEESLKMIPTGYKVKIPSALSYCCSAKMISLAWQDVPQFEFLKLSFSCHNVAQSLRQQKKPRQILWVSYRNRRINQFSSVQMEESGFYQPHWDVSVKVCRSEHAHEVRQWLLETGLELGRQWLLKVAPLRDEHANLSWSAFFDEEERTFSITHRE